MQRIILIFTVGFAVVNARSLQAQPNDEAEIKALIVGQNISENPIPYSAKGALEFWSSGGLVNEVPASGRSSPFDEINLAAKHIQVLVLVPGEAAVAHFYSEGTMKPKGLAPVTNYLTRVSQVFVKEEGEWRIRSSHWSPVRGSSGTSQWVRPAASTDDGDM